MNMGFFAFLAMAVAMWISSALRGDLTPQQVRKNRLCQKFSGISHIGLWADVLLLPWLTGTIFDYHSQWSVIAVVISVVPSLIISAQMHRLWIKTQPSDHNLVAKKNLTTAGHIHLIFMAAYLSLTALFYFFTDDINPQHLKWVTILLGTHVSLATVGLNIVRQKRLDPSAVITALVVWAILLWRLWQ